jgi:hypothetical protein
MKTALLFFLSASCLIAADADATARYLAGLSVSDGAARELTWTRDWKAHSRAMNASWQELERAQLTPLRKWTQANLLRGLGADCPVFYFFGGPDALYAQAFHPQAPVHILCGMEPVGALPELATLDAKARAQVLAGLRQSLSSALNWSFFRTESMAVDLKATAAKGTLPILCTYLARRGCTVEAVNLVGLDDAGNLVPAAVAITPGVRIGYRAAGAARAQRLFYFQTDLSNTGVHAHPGFIAFCKSLGTGHGLLKAASYLLHNESFSVARHFLTTRCRSLVQDDSGVPLRDLVAQRWMVLPHGNYPGPIDLFKQRFQPDVARLFQNAQHRHGLGFSFGYQWKARESTLLYGIALGYAPPTAPVAVAR